MNCNFVWFNLPKQVKEKVINVPKGWFMLVQELNIHLDYLKATYPEHYATIFIPKYKITWWGLVFRDLPKLCQFYDTLPPPIINRFEYVTGTAPTLQDFETTIGFTLLNGVKTGDVITFDNVGYHIADNAFNGNTDLLNITTAPNVTAGDYCFLNCTSLTNTGSVKTAGNGCFANCTNLTSTGSVTTAGDNCFADLTGLTSTGSVTTAGGYCFGGCTNLTSIDSVITAGHGCFQNCTNLTSTGSVTTAGYGCFQDLTGLTSIGSVTTAGDYCFYNCTSLTSTGSVTTAGNTCFGDCTNLTSTGSVTTAGDGCFYGCTSLITINFTNTNNIGTTTGNDSVFDGITGNTITITAKAIHQTSNNGNLEGDLQYLADNNNVTFIWV